jgi:lipopolysaccharide transport system permease protein
VADQSSGAVAYVPGKGVLASGVVSFIRPAGAGSAPLYAELWSYRDLLVVLAIRDISVRYKQTVLGIGWAVIQPLATMLILSFVFGYVAHFRSERVPYYIFVLSGVLPWTFFSQVFGRVAGCLVANGNLLGKVYFPRLIIPLSVVATPLVDFAITLTLLLTMMAWRGVTPGWRLLALPLLVALAAATAMAVGLILTSLDVRYRDIGHLVPFLLQSWMYASPVAYPAGAVPGRWRFIYDLNPITGVIEGFRWALLRTSPINPWILALNVATVSALLLAGLALFRRTEETMADLI